MVNKPNKTNIFRLTEVTSGKNASANAQHARWSQASWLVDTNFKNFKQGYVDLETPLVLNKHFKWQQNSLLNQAHSWITFLSVHETQDKHWALSGQGLLCQRSYSAMYWALNSRFQILTGCKQPAKTVNRLLAIHKVGCMPGAFPREWKLTSNQEMTDTWSHRWRDWCAWQSSALLRPSPLSFSHTGSPSSEN